MKTKTTTYYEIKHGNAINGGDKNKFSYDTKEEAIKSAIDFKNNPIASSPSMTESNVKYWKSEEFTVIKKTVTTEEIITI